LEETKRRRDEKTKRRKDEETKKYPDTYRLNKIASISMFSPALVMIQDSMVRGSSRGHFRSQSWNTCLVFNPFDAKVDWQWNRARNKALANTWARLQNRMSSRALPKTD